MTDKQLQLLKLVARYVIIDADADGRTLTDLTEVLWDVEREESKVAGT